MTKPLQNLVQNLPVSGMTAIVQKFLHAQDIMDSSKETYERNLTGFLLWMADKKLKNPTHEDILAYKNELHLRSLSPHSVANYMTAIKQFFHWTHINGFYPDIAENIKSSSGPKKGRFCKDALTVEQVLAMLNAVDISQSSGLRDYAMLNLMVRVGLRSIEVARANIEDLQQKEHRHILWVQGKGRHAKDEFVVLNDESLAPIRQYLATRTNIRGQSPLFVSVSSRNQDERLTTRSISRVAKNILKDIDLNSPRLSCHSLRHTAVTLALRGGAPIRQAQRMARHASVLTTERYAHDLEALDHPAEDNIAEILHQGTKANS